MISHRGMVMANYVTLLGAEQVQSAGRAIDTAAETMVRAAASFSDSVDRLARALDEHATRVEAAARGDV